MENTCYNAVIFDLDGTLVDSLDDLADAMNSVLESLGFPTHPRSPYRRFVGDGVAMLVRRAVPADVEDEGLIAEYVGMMREEYARRWLNKTRPYPGVLELLSALRDHGLKTAVLSNKPDPATRTIVSKLFADHPFHHVQGALPDTPLKPDPTTALEVSTKLDVPAQRTIYVGDTNIDMRTGRRAGMFTVGVTWGFRDEAELRSSGAQRIVHHPLELLEVLRE
jgi:phosphoglycolate phosphatase